MSGKQERHGPDGPLNDLTGKAIVNDGPNEREELLETNNEPGTGIGTGTKAEAAAGGGGPASDGGSDGASAPASDGASAPASDAGSDPASDAGSDSASHPAFGAGSASSGGFDTDELALRRMLRGAVEDLEPSQAALDHLRKAVPARRARRRQAVVGMAAAAVFVGMAVPAFVHVTNSGSDADDRPSIAGHGEDTHGGTGWEKEVEGAKKGKADKSSDGPATKDEEKKRQNKERDREKDASGTRRGGGTDEADAPGGVRVATPTCDATQLGVASSGAGTPDSEGKVYGTFRIVNISGTECAVSGGGAVSFLAAGAADSARIDVVEHTSGDAAAGLPDPSQETTGLLLAPDMAYEVKFAWVPTDTCPTTDPTPEPPPPTEDPGPGPGPGPGTADGGTGDVGGTGTGDGGGTGEGEGEQTGTQTQLGTEDGGTEDGSVSVTHTPESGAPSAAATVPNACAGTIYRTGVLEAS
ncbi:hypothetical protein [Streptomyces hypolithicus]